jgi:hypothetical protein
MKKIIVAVFLVLALFAIQGAYAEQSPESIVACPANNGFVVGGLTVPAAINTELCAIPDMGNKCATCIRSLENQGCKVIDVDYQTLRFDKEYGDLLVAIYLLSCDRR